MEEEESHKVRLAKLSDSAEIARLSVELGYAATSEEIASRLPAFLESSAHFVAVVPGPDSQLLAWIVAERRIILELGEKAEITGLVVSTSAKRAGLGRKLVSAAEQWSTRQGLASICVQSNVIRAESHPFYERLGFVRIKTQHVYEKPLRNV